MKGPIILILILTTIYIKGKANNWIMAEDSDTDTELGALGPLEHDYASGGLSEGFMMLRICSIGAFSMLPFCSI